MVLSQSHMVMFMNAIFKVKIHKSTVALPILELLSWKCIYQFGVF